MAILYISEFNAQAHDGENNIAPIARLPSNVDQTVAIGGSTTASSAFASNTNFIRVHTDSICSIAVGITPTATTSNLRLAAGQTEYFAVSPGLKIAVIANT